MTRDKAWFTAVVVATFMTAFTGHSTARMIRVAAAGMNGEPMRMPLQMPAPTFPAPGCADIGPVKVFCSVEVGDATKEGRLLVDTLDDPWRSAAAGATFVVGRIRDTELPTVVAGMFSPVVTVSLQNVTSVDLTNPTGRGTAHEKQGYAAFAGLNTMQEGAPKPVCLAAIGEPAWNEDVGREDSRNAVLFTFDPPISAFGAWFGDLETRSDNQGTPAILRLFDSSLKRIGEDLNIPSSTSNQEACMQRVPGCGNQTTRWIGFVAPDSQPVSEMLVVVGDDDRLDKNDGKLEHLGFIGPTLAYVPLPVATAVPIVRSDLPVRIHLPLQPKGLRVDPRLAEDVCEG